MRLPAAAAAALAAALAAASGGCGNDASPSPATTTITITSGGAAPRAITVPRGSQVTIINNDSRAHVMVSDPHPEHTDCPEINAVGSLNPGERRQTGNLNTVRSCGFHDHEDADNRSLRGTISIE